MNRIFDGKQEVEILKFMVNEKYYGIDISNVKEILAVKNFVEYPNTKLEILGMSLIRNEIVTLIDLSYILDGIKTDKFEEKMTLKYQYENMNLAFVVDKIVGIKVMHKDDIEDVEKVVDNDLIIGNAKLDDDIYMIIDFDKVIEEIM